MEELLTILKNLCDKHVTVTNKDSKIYRDFRHKITFRQFCLSTDDPVLRDKRVRPYNNFKTLRFENVNGCF